MAGSATKTGWKRLSRAGSFSIYFRYSVTVVVPIACNCPRAREGFRILEASIAPSPAPAPTKFWISSIKTMIWPEAAWISLSKFFNLCSNWPRCPAPAIKDIKSKESILLFNKGSGASPLAILWARPSTMAVLPTPASPIKQGLFLVRLERIWITLSISAERPTTGSSFPSRACWVKSWQNCSKDEAAFLASSLTSFFPVTFLFKTSTVILNFAKTWAPTPSPSWTIAKRMCSGEINSKPRERAAERASSKTRFTRGENWGCPLKSPFLKLFSSASWTSLGVILRSESSWKIPESVKSPHKMCSVSI